MKVPSFVNLFSSLNEIEEIAWFKRKIIDIYQNKIKNGRQNGMHLCFTTLSHKVHSM